MTAEKIIKKLKLKPLKIEGGYFKETYRSKEKIKSRNCSTLIYYLITKNSFSRLHRIKSDEIFHFYCGDPVEMFLIYQNGKTKKVILGKDILKGMKPQVIIPKNVWQGSRIKKNGKYALLGTTVSPGFDYKDYESGDRQKLIKRYPNLKKIIIPLTNSK